MSAFKERAQAFENAYSFSFLTVLGEMISFGTEDFVLGLAFKKTMDSQNPTHRFLLTQEAQLPQQRTDLLLYLENSINDYLIQKTDQLKVPYKLFGTPFQLASWEALAKVPMGRTITYQEQAKSIGRPKAARAVGQANRVNFLPIILPCHRVVSLNSPYHYAGSPSIKKNLLKRESVMGLTLDS